MSGRRQVALLRGVNVGKAKKVEMARLRALAERLGHTEVSTVLNSGNLVLTVSPGQRSPLAAQLEAALQEEFGFPVRVLTRSAGELAALVAGTPFPQHTAEGSRLVVVFLETAPDPSRLAALPPPPPEQVVLAGEHVYVWCPDGQLASEYGHPYWEKSLGVVATARTWNTVVKLAACAVP